MVSPSLARMTAQVHITGLPMPKNLSESKLLLAALQKFGEVITYRNLKVQRPLSITVYTSPDLTIPLVRHNQHLTKPKPPYRCDLRHIRCSRPRDSSFAHNHPPTDIHLHIHLQISTFNLYPLHIYQSTLKFPALIDPRNPTLPPQPRLRAQTQPLLLHLQPLQKQSHIRRSDQR